MSWLTDAVVQSLLEVDYNVLLSEAAHHVQQEGSWESGWVRPSLLGDECPLSRVKKYLGHAPQPNKPWSAVRQGQPNAATAMFFLRGNLFEGVIVAALNHSPHLKVLGVSPSLVFRAGTRGVDGFEAHPDVLIDRDGVLELIQIKCPSVFAFDRYEKTPAYMTQRYSLQMMAEMYVGRKMGFGVTKNHLLLGTWEGWPPSQKVDGVRFLSQTIDWSMEYEAIVETTANAIWRDAAKAKAGEWPQAFPVAQSGRWPCVYCNWARVDTDGQTVTCVENEKWDIKPYREATA